MTDDDLIERCAQAAKDAYSVTERDEMWRVLARAVLEAAAHQPPAQAPITADDVRAAERCWSRLNVLAPDEQDRAAFLADWLNRRGER